MGGLFSKGGMQCNSNRFEVLDAKRPLEKQRKMIKPSLALPMVKIEKHWQTLYEAAANSNASDFKKVLELVSKEKQEQTKILSFVGPSEDTLLHVAAKHGNGEIVELIVEKVPSLLNKKGFNDDTVWHIAAKTGKVIDQLFELRDKFERVLSHGKKGAKVTVTWDDLSLRGTNEEGNTALHEALINSRMNMADLLVRHDLDLSLYVNKEKKSALYLAAEAGFEGTVKYMLEKVSAGNMCQEDGKLKLKGKSIVHAAILGKNIAVLALILDCKAKFIETIKEDQGEKEVRLIETKDEEGMNPLHWAASIGFLEGVKYLLLDKKISMFKDKKKLHPIHCSSMNGHVEVVKELLKHDSTLKNLVNRDGHNVLHLAAKHGRHNVVSYILDSDKTPKLAYLLNKEDAQKNTPLHLATIHWHPKVVSTLTWDNRVDLNLTNEEGLTALDAALLNMKGISSFRQWLTWQVLKAAGASRATSSTVVNAKRTASMKAKPTNNTNYKITVRALLLVSIIVMMVSFETGSKKLAYDNNFDTYMGITTSIPHIKNHLFVFCNTVSMYTSIAVIAVLVVAHFCNANMAFATLMYARPLLGMAVTMTTLASMPGVYPVGSKFYWLIDAILTTSMASLVFFAMLFFPVCFPLPPYQILRYITYIPIGLMIFHVCDLVEEWFLLMS